MKKINLFGKSVSVLAIMVIAFAGLGSATLLLTYGTITGTVTIDQSVLVNGKDVNSGSLDLVDNGGVYTLLNNANVSVTVKLTTQQSGYGSSNGIIEGITTSYYGVVELTTKDVVFGSSPWTTNSDASATVHYSLSGNTFTYEITEHAGFDLSGYTLIYYKDNSDRFSNPALAIKVSDLTGSIPLMTDGNVDEYNYCSGGNTDEDYTHCHGAKMWLVPTTDINPDNTLNWGNSDVFLFETDLMAYSMNTDGEITLPANGGGVNFVIVNDFNLALYPGTYTITTNIVPKV